MKKSKLLPAVQSAPDIKAKARALGEKLHAECQDAMAKLESVIYEIDALGPYPEDGPDVTDATASELISEWLDRQRLLGLISPEGAAAVERLIGDLG